MASDAQTVAGGGVVVALRETFSHPGAQVIGLASVKHLVEGVIALTTTEANTSLGLSEVFDHIPELPALSPNLSVAVMFLVSAGLGIYGLRARIPGHIRTMLLIPQQLLLFVVCFGVLEAMVLGHYPDGTERGAAFILADQILRLLMAPAYTIAIVARNRW